MAGYLPAIALRGRADAVLYVPEDVTRNTNNCALYIKNAGDFEKTTAEAAVLCEDEAMRRYALSRLRLVQGIDPALFEKRFGAAMPGFLMAALDDFARRGLAQEKDGAFVPTRKGLFEGIA